MQNHLVTLAVALALTPLAAAIAQQKVDIRRSSTANVSVRLNGAIASVKVIAWPNDSIALIGVLAAGSKMDGGPSSVSGPIAGMKFYVEASDEASMRGNKLELRVPRNARVWIKAGSADIEVQGVGGGLDLNIVGGSIQVHGKPRELIMESMDGSVSFTGFAEYARIKTATGNIVLEGGGEDLTFSTVSGSIQAATGERPLQRARFESVTGPIVFDGAVTRGADMRFDTHSGSIELRFPPKALVEVDAATVLGTIENAWNYARPVAGREGRGMELGASSGMGAARVLVRSFKGSVKLAAK